MNRKIVAITVTCIAVITLTPSYLTTAVDLNQVSVSAGDTFNLEVIENPKSDKTRPTDVSDITKPTDVSDFTKPERYTPGEGGGFSKLELNIENYMSSLPFMVPAQGFVFSVTVDSVPSNESAGKFGVDIDNDGDYDYESSEFILGMPVVSTDWKGWVETVNEILNTANKLDTVETASLDMLTNTSSMFGFTFTFDIQMTEEMISKFSSMEITHSVSYYKGSGIIANYEFTSNLVSSRGETTSTTRLQFTTKTLTAPEPLDNIYLLAGAFLGIVSLSGFGLYYYRSQKLTAADELSQQQVAKTKKQMNATKD
ncbi:MAG: hypothetical protein ACXAEU_09260, partial [Candidatus Hodarchaeales archaeon]